MPKRSQKATEKAVKTEMHTPVKKQATKVLSTMSEVESPSQSGSGGFQVGDKVFAKVKSCPQPWPAKILQKVAIQSTLPNIPSTPGKKQKEKAKAGGIKFLIQFYGTYDSEHVKPEQLIPYTDANNNKLGRSNPSRGATLFQVAMKEIQSSDSYPLPRTRRQGTRPTTVRQSKTRKVRQSTPPPRPPSAPIEEVQTPGNMEREDSFFEAESTLEPESPVPSTVASAGAGTPLSGLRASQTQTDPVKIQEITDLEVSELQQQQQQELAYPLQEPEQEVNMEEGRRTRKRTASASAEEPKPKKAEKQKGGKKGKKPKGK